MTMVKFYVSSLTVLIAVSLIFRYVGDFSLMQSLLVGVVASGGWGLYQTLAISIRIEKAFSPFWVRVSPNWYDLLHDYKLIECDEKTFWDDAGLAWQEANNESDWSAAPTYRALRDDIVFTVLKPSPFEGLIYLNSHRIFRSEVDLEERIEEVKVARPVECGGRRSWSPDLYLKWGSDGYELGLEVNAEWWRKTCAEDESRQLAKIKTDHEHLSGTIRLAVATLPYAEFELYRSGNATVSSFDAAALKGREAKRDAELAKAGWKREQKDWDLYDLGAPEGVKHRYFAVEHRAI